MTNKKVDYTSQLHDEIDLTPEEYRPLLLRLVHSFREGVIELPSAEATVRDGWKDVSQDSSHSTDHLWDGIDIQ